MASTGAAPPPTAGLSRLQEFFVATPLVTLAILCVCVAVFVADSIGDFGAALAAFSISPVAVFGDAQVYRIVTAAYTHGSILHLGMNMVSLVSLGSSLEPLFGSLGFFFLITLYTLFIGVTFLALATAAAFVGATSFWWQSAVGFSGVLFALAVDESSLSPAPSRSVFGLFSVPTRLYPWVLMVLLQVLIPGVSFIGHLAGVLVGAAHAGGLLTPLLPKLVTLHRLEQCAALGPVVRSPPYRSVPPNDPVLMAPSITLASLRDGVMGVLRPVTDCCVARGWLRRSAGASASGSTGGGSTRGSEGVATGSSPPPRSPRFVQNGGRLGSGSASAGSATAPRVAAEETAPASLASALFSGSRVDDSDASESDAVSAPLISAPGLDGSAAPLAPSSHADARVKGAAAAEARIAAAAAANRPSRQQPS